MKQLVPLVVLLLFFAFGCGKGDSRNNPLFLKGEQYRREGDPVLAEKFFRRFLEQSPDSAIGHLALATLYDESLANPSAALYHYDEYLRLTPQDAADRPAAEGYRAMARSKLRAVLAGEELPALPVSELAAENRKLRAVNDQLKRYILGQHRKIEQLQQSAPPQPAGERLYVVLPGDTPGKIAKKFYGSAAKFRPIMEANNLTGNGNLRVGQQLVIPPGP